MALVAMLMAALLLLPAAVTALAVGEFSPAGIATNSPSALAAAQSGLSAYMNALDHNSNFYNNTAESEVSGTVDQDTAFGGATAATAFSNPGTGTWEQVPGSTNECYFYVPSSATSAQVTLTVTGRYGAYTGNCVAESNIAYQYKTLSATLEPNSTNPFVYFNEYDVANPTAYGAYSGDLANCGYYAYSQNPNWEWGYLGLYLGSDFTFDFGFIVGSVTIWNVTTPTWYYVQTTGGATNYYGPSEGGAIIADNSCTPGCGDLLYVATTGDPYGDGDTTLESGFNPNSADSPNGCQLLGTPFHDGYWSNLQNFNGDESGDNYDGSAAADYGSVYTSDEYYVCNSWPGSTDVNWWTGDPYTSATEPSMNADEDTPTAIDWSLGVSIDDVFSFTLTFFDLAAKQTWNLAQNVTPNYVVGAWDGGIDLTIFNISFEIQAMTICSAPSSYPTINRTTSAQATPLPSSSGSFEVFHPPLTTSGTSTTPDYGLTTDLDPAETNGCVYLASADTDTVTFDFVSSGGADVTLGGGTSVAYGSGGSIFNNEDTCTGNNVSPPDGIFFVENGDALVEGTVEGKYTVAAAYEGPLASGVPNGVYTAIEQNVSGGESSTNASLATFPGSDSGSDSTANTVLDPFDTAQNTPSGGGYLSASDNQASSTSTYYFPYSIYLIGSVTYNLCTVPLTVANCNNYLGLLSQNDVVVSYPIDNLTVDADIDAVWGSFLLDQYGYWGGPSFSAPVAYFFCFDVDLVITSFTVDLPNEYVSSDGSNCNPTGGSTIGTLTVNGSVVEFWRGILTHFEAYDGFEATGGYATTDFDYDGRFQHELPPGMPSVPDVGPELVPPQWSIESLSTDETSLCPTGSYNSSATTTTSTIPITQPGDEYTTPCSVK